MGTLSNNSKVGDKGKDLILQTSGRVYVQVKDRFYEINFRGDDEEDKDEEKEETPQVIFVDNEDSLTDLQYPGDNYLILTKDGKFFITENEGYTPVSIASQINTTFTTPLTITTLEAPFNINSTNLVKNLNSEYLNGISSSSFARKNLNETISRWTITDLISDSIRDSEGKSSLNLKNGSLTIDTIRVKNLILSDDSGGNEENPPLSESDFDIINKKTYFSNGILIKAINIIDKLDSSISLPDIQYFSNENYLVGGYSIIDLIYTAFNDGLLLELGSIVDYANTLTSCQKLNSNNQWGPHTLNDTDFVLNEEGIYPYKQYKFLPVSSSVYEQYKYGSDRTCLEGIYNRWYNITDYTGDIASKYQGVTFELTLEKHSLKAGDFLSGKNNDGTIDVMVVGCTEFSARVILSGSDCYFTNTTEIDIYNEWAESPPVTEPNKTIYENITSCLEEQDAEKGSSISADPKVGDILFTGSSGNIIGNISGTENSIFGTLEGYGLTSEGNCYFVNPGIALVNTDNLNYLKFYNKEQSFIGINKKNEKWITTETDGSCDMRRDRMYNINNHLSFCSFGPIRVEEDGSATIGSGETQITITADGKVQIPEACIIK